MRTFAEEFEAAPIPTRCTAVLSDLIPLAAIAYRAGGPAAVAAAVNMSALSLCAHITETLWALDHPTPKPEEDSDAVA